ncbi:MAG TPA: NAD(P)-dependent oxidoreductase [Burkholderiaceae bacterium]|nr:NAD(P)-dependent oxidoreductase [Burkholderiaceae bacterium]
MSRSIGLIGVGLMGLGIALNLARKGQALAVLDHPGNQPLDELRPFGVTVRPTPAALAADREVVILCVTGSPQVEAVLSGPEGVLSRLRPGTVVVDCSTAVPESTERMARAVEAAGGRFVDAPMTRTPKHAREGTLNLLVGGEAELVESLRPVLGCFAENVAHVGPVGAGHRMKLLHNFVSLGSVALIAEAAALAGRAGIAPEVLVEVLARGGGGGVALERLAPYLKSGDASGLTFFMANAAKDLRYYTTMAANAGAADTIAEAVAATYEEGVRRGGERALVPELATLLAAPRG